MKKAVRLLAVTAVVSMVAVACSNDSSSTSTSAGGSTSTGAATIGPGEGALSLIAWAGYTEDSWVKPFEQDTGCKVDVKYGNTSDEMVNLMRQGGGTLYDGVSASGDASNRLDRGRRRRADRHVDVPRLRRRDAVAAVPGAQHRERAALRCPVHVGPELAPVQHGRREAGADQLGRRLRRQQPVRGKVTAYDSPIYIADAALYLKATQPDLGITDPYELTTDQLDAATELLKTQFGLIGKYWAIYTDEIKGFDSGDMVIGTAWPVNQQYIELDNKVPVESTIPTEGVTGWADTWMMSSHATHPNCMMMWMQYTLQPDVQTEVAEFYGATPSNSASCKQLDKDLGSAAEIYHCGDDAFLSSVALWKTPLADCGNGSTDCMDYNAWTQKWLDIQSGG